MVKTTCKHKLRRAFDRHECFIIAVQVHVSWLALSILEEDNKGHLDKYFTSLSLGAAGPVNNTDHSIHNGTNTNYFEMPIRRKRSSPTSEDTRSKKARVGNWSRQRSEDDQAFSNKRCVAWFHEYTGPDDDTLGPEGMEKFCEDIGVEPENIVMLSLAWKLGAQTMGFFTKAEWLKGMTELQCDCQRKLQQKLDNLRSYLDDPVRFKNIYRFAFDFARDKDQRSMDIETAKAMLALLLGKHWSLFPSFNMYLEQSKYKVINKDQWCNILEFSRSIMSDLSNYDEDGAWPVLLDEFVEWLKESRTMSS